MPIKINGLEREEKRRTVFSWLTRSGIGRRFPGTPIGWYQMHQMCAVDVLKEAAGAGKNETIEVRARRGMYDNNIEVRRQGERRWRAVGQAKTLFDRADRCTRR